MAKKQSTPYVLNERREYSLYVIRQRAIPNITDGLKSAARRVLWTARDGKKWKSAALAGATMPIHPHAAPEGTIDTLAAPYGNNIPLLKGDGAFGTMLKPTAYGASRYTAVTVSKFTQDVVFADLDIIPMVDNYDNTVQEPAHFLPLVPIALINPQEGKAVGYATNILSRALDDIILAQITHLKGGKKLSNPTPQFFPTNAVAVNSEETERGVAYYFEGDLNIKDTSTATVTQLPYGMVHATFVDKLNTLIEREIIVDYIDRSRRQVDIDVKFKRGSLKGVDKADLLTTLGLKSREIENLNVIDVSGSRVLHLTAPDLIRQFTDWRLTWYVKRYERLRDLLKVDIQRYYDIRTAIVNNVGGVAKKTSDRSQLKELLTKLGIVYVDYIADLPVYRFTEAEKQKNEERIKEALAQLQVYEDLLASEDKRKAVYISELKDVLTKYTKGQYN